MAGELLSADPWQRRPASLLRDSVWLCGDRREFLSPARTPHVCPLGRKHPAELSTFRSCTTCHHPLQKLKNCENQIDTLFTRLRGLETKIGPVVFQLPSRWRCNLRRLEEFSRRLPESFRYVFEFQDATWHTRDVFKLLEKNGFGLTVPLDDPSRPCLITTTDIVYLRLRSPKNSKTGSYHAQTLRGWAGRIHGWTRKGKNVYVLFDGEDSSAVLKNAQRIRKYLEPPAKTLPCV